MEKIPEQFDIHFKSVALQMYYMVWEDEDINTMCVYLKTYSNYTVNLIVISEIKFFNKLR